MQGFQIFFCKCRNKILSDDFLFFKIIYLTEKRESVCSLVQVHSQNGKQEPRLGQAKARSKEHHVGLHCEWQALKCLSHDFLPFTHIIPELGQKWSSQDWNCTLIWCADVPSGSLVCWVTVPILQLIFWKYMRKNI